MTKDIESRCHPHVPNKGSTDDSNNKKILSAKVKVPRLAPQHHRPIDQGLGISPTDYKSRRDRLF